MLVCPGGELAEGFFGGGSGLGGVDDQGEIFLGSSFPGTMLSSAAAADSAPCPCHGSHDARLHTASQRYSGHEGSTGVAIEIEADRLERAA